MHFLDKKEKFKMVTFNYKYKLFQESNKMEDTRIGSVKVTNSLNQRYKPSNLLKYATCRTQRYGRSSLTCSIKADRLLRLCWPYLENTGDNRPQTVVDVEMQSMATY